MLVSTLVNVAHVFGVNWLPTSMSLETCASPISISLDIVVGSGMGPWFNVSLWELCFCSILSKITFLFWGTECEGERDRKRDKERNTWTQSWVTERKNNRNSVQASQLLEPSPLPPKVYISRKLQFGVELELKLTLLCDTGVLSDILNIHSYFSSTFQGEQLCFLVDEKSNQNWRVCLKWSQYRGSGASNKFWSFQI